MSRHPAVQRLIGLVTQECRDHNVRFRLSPGEYVNDDGAQCGGYFDEDHLAVACGMRGLPEWWMILAHEYCHMRQWLAGAKVWKRCDTNWFFSWVAGGKPRAPRSKIRRQALAHLDVELDCERRTVRLADEMGLPYDREAYIRGANAYVLFYATIPMTRSWYTRAPHRSRSVLNLMPSTFMPRRWYLNPQPDYVTAMFRHCLSPARQRGAWRWLLAA